MRLEALAAAGGDLDALGERPESWLKDDGERTLDSGDSHDAGVAPPDAGAKARRVGAGQWLLRRGARATASRALEGAAFSGHTGAMRTLAGFAHAAPGDNVGEKAAGALLFAANAGQVAAAELLLARAGAALAPPRLRRHARGGRRVGRRGAS